MTTNQLDQLRRKVAIRALRVNRVIDARRSPPWCPHRTAVDDLIGTGFRRIEDPEQTPRELNTMLAFLDLWFELSPVTEIVVWPNSEYDRR